MYLLLQELLRYDIIVYNRIIFAVFFYFVVLKIHVASKDLEQTAFTNKLFEKTLCKCGNFATWLLNYNQLSRDLRLTA